MSHSAYHRHDAARIAVAMRPAPNGWRDLVRDWKRWSPEERFTALALASGVAIILPLFFIAFGQAFGL
jgi:hypothetical protein